MTVLHYVRLYVVRDVCHQGIDELLEWSSITVWCCLGLCIHPSSPAEVRVLLGAMQCAWRACAVLAIKLHSTPGQY